MPSDRHPQSREDAAAILASAPSILSKVAAFVQFEGDGADIDWAKVAELSRKSLFSSEQRAFLGICADIAGINPGGADQEGTFGARWEALDSQHQSMIASVLTASAQTKNANERAQWARLGFSRDGEVAEDARGRNVVRVRLNADHPAVTNDALGRERVGFREGAGSRELWLRGRGVWRMQADRVMASRYLLIAHAGIVRMVGTIDGISIHGDRLAIVGTPLPGHPLIGKPDPLDNASQNPVAYGTLDLG
ncbi:hypothetical protein [Propionibacterium sp.]|uniref:hypothetical protein n=1 Tax=Propionibacterium sp. TaxID=1977903 RepID=UPI0039EA7D26